MFNWGTPKGGEARSSHGLTTALASLASSSSSFERTGGVLWNPKPWTVHMDPKLEQYFNHRSDDYVRTYSAWLSGGSFWSRVKTVRWFPMALLHRITVDAAAKLVLPGASALDLGCGTGELSRELGKLGASVHAVDASPAMVATARRSAPTAEVHLADLETWEPPEGTAALAVMLCVTDYLPHPGPLLRRLGNHSTSLIITFPALTLVTRVRHVIYRLRGQSGHAWSRRESEALLREAGWRIDNYRFIFPGTHWFVASRGLTPGTPATDHDLEARPRRPRDS